MLMLLAALQMMPKEPQEAARIDGANAVQLFWHVRLPYIRPTLLVAGAVPPDRQHQGVSADLRADRRRAGRRDRGHQLLRLPADVQFLLLGLWQRGRRR